MNKARNLLSLLEKEAPVCKCGGKMIKVTGMKTTGEPLWQCPECGKQTREDLTENPYSGKADPNATVQCQNCKHVGSEVEFYEYGNLVCPECGSEDIEFVKDSAGFHGLGKGEEYRPEFDPSRLLGQKIQYYKQGQRYGTLSRDAAQKLIMMGKARIVDPQNIEAVGDTK